MVRSGIPGAPGSEDLVQTTLMKLYRRQEIEAGHLSAAYIRRMLFTTYIDERRKGRWSHEICVADLPERQFDDPDITNQRMIRDAIQELDAYVFFFKQKTAYEI